MALTPSDIEQKTFSTTLRGYDLDEVDDFLDDVVATLRSVQDQLAVAKTAQSQTAPGDDESAVGRALIAAQTTADQMIADAKEEAEKILGDATDEASTWASERDAKKAEADAEMSELAQHVANVRAQLAVLATLVADRLDEMDQTIIGQDHWPTQVIADDDDVLVTAEDPLVESTGDAMTEVDLGEMQEKDPDADGSDSDVGSVDADSEVYEDQEEDQGEQKEEDDNSGTADG